VNRLLGVAWLAQVARGRLPDAALERDVRMFYDVFYHLQLTDAQ
jgi:hypothetical protein